MTPRDGAPGAGRYWRLRVGVAAAWIAVSLAAVWIAWPDARPANRLRADVKVVEESLVGGEQILVRNESEEPWTDVRITLDGTWTFEQSTLRPLGQVVLSTDRFRRGAEPAPRTLRPREITIECRQGRARIRLR